MLASTTDASPMVPARTVMNRYGVVSRTLDRWVKNAALGFPAPVVINRRRYFRLAELEQWERERAAGRAA